MKSNEMLALAEGVEAESPGKNLSENKQTRHILKLKGNRTLAILVKGKLPAHGQHYDFRKKENKQTRRLMAHLCRSFCNPCGSAIGFGG